jgi:hypothetical protein
MDDCENLARSFRGIYLSDQDHLLVYDSSEHAVTEFFLAAAHSTLTSSVV